jgi:hypothetical protein
MSRKPKHAFKFVEHFKTNDKEQLNKLLNDIVTLYFTSQPRESVI